MKRTSAIVPARPSARLPPERREIGTSIQPHLIARSLTCTFAAAHSPDPTEAAKLAEEMEKRQRHVVAHRELW